MTDDRDTLLEIAGAVTDGAPVDWAAKLRGGEAPKDRLDRLRVIEKIALVHGGARAEVPARSPGPSQNLTASLAAEDPPPALPAPSRWGHLRIIERIGKGGYGDVYRAYDSNLQVEVALKLLRPDRKLGRTDDRHFLDEARRLARVRHPNVLTVHGADRHDGQVGLWTDLLQGKTLEECIEQQGPYGAEEAGLIGIELCRALAAVHGAGLIHRDVKTSNVMREKGGRIVLMDFSSTTESDPQLEGAEGAPTTGTPLFMAPELLKGEEPTIASDIYSLGVLLYRLVGAAFPVHATTLPELIEKHERGRFVPLHDVRPTLPSSFAQVIERALARDPEHRFSSVGEMERALRSSLGICDETDDDAQEPVKWYRRWRVALGTLVAAVVAAGIGLVLFPGLGPGRFQVDASLYRFGDGTEERLLPGASVSLGDLLFLEIEGSTRMHVYVMSEDANGQTFRLFPLPGLDLANPLSPGTPYRLPGAVSNTSKYWEVTSAGGRETFLVIASREALEDVERELARLRLAGSENAAEPNQRAAAPLRGVGGLAEQAPSLEEAEAGRLSGIVKNLAGQAANRSGVWIWEIELTNAAP
jgi:hypothetical protein